MIKNDIVVVKGTSLDYGRWQNNEQFAAARILLLDPLIQRRDSSNFMRHVEHVASCYSVYCMYYSLYYVQYNTNYINFNALIVSIILCGS